MKKLFVFMVFVFFLTFPGVTYAYNDPFTVNDYKPLPTMPSQLEHYYMSYSYVGLWGHGDVSAWYLYYYDDPSKVVINIESGTGDVRINQLPGLHVQKWRACAKYDLNVNPDGGWYIEDWWLESEGINSGSTLGRFESVYWFSHDLYTTAGVFYIDAHPFPAPPPLQLALEEGGALILTVLGGSLSQVLPISLVLLVILLVVSLVVLLLRSYLLRRL